MMPAPQPGAGFAQFETLPAPMEGINAVTGFMEMRPTEALYALNVIFSQGGPTVRPGYTEWAINNTGTGGVRTLIPVRGAGTAGAQDHLFACTLTGIWDVSSSTSVPTQVVTFGTQSGNAGYCEYDFSVNANGDVTLLVCDEVNGYYTFDCSTTTWTQITQAFSGTGTATGTTALTINSTLSGVIQIGAELYTNAGGVLTDTGLHIVSGSGTAWVLSGNATLAAANIVIMSGSQIFGVNPATFVQPRVFGAFIHFVQGGTGLSWYGQFGGFLGQMVSFGWGNKFPHGGNLKYLNIFTFGSAYGTYTYLIGIGDAGDVLAYQGINPSNAATWTLSGQWYVGDVPAGRRFVTNYGGDLIILCAYGLVKISSLFSNQNPEDPNLHLDKNIAPAMAADFTLLSALFGFQFVPWPAQNSLLVLEPIVAGSTYKQWCYNLATSAWSIFNTLQMQCAAFWHGNLYFGDSGGRVLQASGNVDNQMLNGTPGVAINFGMLGAFQKGKIQGNKFIDLIEPFFTTTSPVSYKTFAQFDFDLTALALGSVSYVGVPTAGGWDSGLWDSAIWGGGGAPLPQFSIQGGQGMGKWFTIGCLGATKGQTTLTGYELSVRPTKGFF
jgi:hypothetical protein